MDGKTPGEDQKLSERTRRLAGALHSADCGWNCPGHGIMQERNDEKYRQLAIAALRHLKIDEIETLAYQAGYAEAVARLRDDDRYRDWWTATPERSFGTAYWAPDGRRHLADYLETVGVDQ